MSFSFKAIFYVQCYARLDYFVSFRLFTYGNTKYKAIAIKRKVKWNSLIKPKVESVLFQIIRFKEMPAHIDINSITENKNVLLNLIIIQMCLLIKIQILSLNNVR